jgi:hypothetical protein
MLWRADIDQYYVVYDAVAATSGRWIRFGSNYNSGGLVYCPEEAPTPWIKPIRGFGDVWCKLRGTNADIGWGADKEYGFGGASSPGVKVQDFQQGVIFQDSDGMRNNWVYLMFFDETFLRVSP